MTNRRCENCRWWLGDAEDTRADCRARSPYMLPDGNYQPTTIWPKTGHDCPGCGDWKNRYGSVAEELAADTKPETISPEAARAIHNASKVEHALRWFREEWQHETGNRPYDNTLRMVREAILRFAMGEMA